MIITSPDGIVWTPRETSAAEPLHQAYWDGDSWLALGEAGTILTSTEGFQWTLRTPGTLERFVDIATNGTTTVALEAEGRIFITGDGDSWQRSGSDLNETFSKLIWDGASFIAVSFNGTILSSTDGKSWEHNAIPDTGGVPDFTSNGDLIVAVSSFSEEVYSSADRVNWTATELPFRASTVVTDGNRFLIPGSQRMWTSTNGIDWTEKPSNTIPSYDNLIWNGAVFAGTDGNAIYLSTDGIDWVRRVPGPREITDIEAFGLGFLACTVRGLVLSSADGVWWDVTETSVDSTLSGIVSDGSEIRLVGANGVVMTGSCFLDGECEFQAKSIIPWVVDNQSWASRVALLNKSERTATVHLQAVNREGETREIQLRITGNSVYAKSASALFPGFSGYSLFINSTGKDLYPSFLTFNTEAESGGPSPSQTTGSFFSDLTSSLLFGYVPGNQISAMVIVAPGEGVVSTPVLLRLYGPDGSVLSVREIELEGNRPLSRLVTDLFEDVPIPDDAVVKAVALNGEKLAGTTFVFNERRQPSMTAAFSTNDTE